MKLSNLTASDYTSLLLKGPWGHGKTISAASFALGGTIFLSYWDKKGPIELVQFFKKIGRPELLKNIEYEVYGAHNANEYLNKLFALSKDCRYFAVINDSVTSMTGAAVNWSLGFRVTDKKASTKDKIMPEFDEYKVETSLVTQALDICTTLPCHVIWTCHPIPSLKMEGSGTSMKVSKVNNIVTYGSKVAGIIPGRFSEIYHFSKLSDWTEGKSKLKYLVSTEAIGDDYAKSNIGLNAEFDITNRLFYEVWREEIKKLEGILEPQAQQTAPAGEAVSSFTNLTFAEKSPWKT